ncbi:hypothetical protein SRABI26_03082 [Arthrobacter sp. Bi26]|nr:hypothetical protein SRABI26_03082 [Arthrobacter sp. Bi26]
MLGNVALWPVGPGSKGPGRRRCYAGPVCRRRGTVRRLFVEVVVDRGARDLNRIGDALNGLVPGVVEQRGVVDLVGVSTFMR